MGKELEGASGDPDCARAMLKAFAEAVMSAETSMECDAAHGERTGDDATRETALAPTRVTRVARRRGYALDRRPIPVSIPTTQRTRQTTANIQST